MTRFSLTYDSLANSLMLVAGEKILDDVTSLTITRSASGEYACDVVRTTKAGTTRYASASRTDQQAGELPGFTVVPDAAAATHHPLTQKAWSVAADIARFLGHVPELRS